MQHLRPIHSERGNHDHSATLHRVVDNVRKLVRNRARRMIAIAVRRFAKKEIRAAGWLRVFQNGLIVAAYVT